jgi:hypothetical protein
MLEGSEGIALIDVVGWSPSPMHPLLPRVYFCAPEIVQPMPMLDFAATLRTPSLPFHKDIRYACFCAEG